MNIMGAREAIDKLAKEYFAIGENASETAYREAYAKMESKKDLWQWMSPANYSSFIINTVYFAEKYDGVPRALEVLDNLYPDYATACPYDYPNKSKIHESWARFHVIQGDESMAYDHLKKAAFYLCIDNYSYDGFEYFSFRGFSDYAFNDIKNNTICLAHPSTFNDPMDTILFKWNQYLIDNAGGAVLSWLIEGAMKVVAADFKVDRPQCVLDAIGAYRDGNDWLGAFINDCCETDASYQEKSGDLYKRYREYCSESGEYVRSTTDFYTALEQAGFKRKKLNSGKYIVGLCLKFDFLD